MISNETLITRAAHIGELAKLHQELSKKHFDIKLERDLVRRVVEEMSTTLNEYGKGRLPDKEAVRQETEKRLRACRNTL